MMCAKINDIGELLDFMKPLYSDGIVPDFDNISVSEIDKDLFDEKGEKEVALIGDRSQVNFGKYSLIYKSKDSGEQTMAFDFKQLIIGRDEQILKEKDALSLRKQLTLKDIDEDDIIFVILDERSENLYSDKPSSRSLTIFCNSGSEDSMTFDSCIFNIDSRINYMVGQIKLLLNLKGEMEFMCAVED